MSRPNKRTPKTMGRPPLYGAAMRARNVRLDDETVAILRELGEGELSEGIRRAAEKLRKTVSR